ncbi:MAG: hypothetical protein M1835_003188, partial [Candelina submexicana]
MVRAAQGAERKTSSPLSSRSKTPEIGGDKSVKDKDDDTVMKSNTALSAVQGAELPAD